MFPPPELSSTGASYPAEFSSEERTILLKLAHAAIATAAAGEYFSAEPPSAHLAELRGVFTTIHVSGKLRGCVGYPAPIAPLYRAVAETAQAAAFEDSRFPPLRAEQIEIGRHGLVISRANQRGLLLPQVPVEHGWDRTTFLEQTCKKAGLPGDAWREGATIEAFTAEVFGDSLA